MRARGGGPDERDAAIRGAASAALDRRQKGRVCAAAARAWAAAGRPGFADQAQDTPPTLRLKEREAFDLWRQDEQRKAIGRLHLTAATQGDYDALLAHFNALAGAGRAADYWTRREVGDDARRARWRLESLELKDAADAIERPEAYVASIAQSRFRTADLHALSAKQVWTLIFDLRRAAARRRDPGRSRQDRKSQGQKAWRAQVREACRFEGRPLPF